MPEGSAKKLFASLPGPGRHLVHMWSWRLLSSMLLCSTAGLVKSRSSAPRHASRKSMITRGVVGIVQVCAASASLGLAPRMGATRTNREGARASDAAHGPLQQESQEYRCQGVPGKDRGNSIMHSMGGEEATNRVHSALLQHDRGVIPCLMPSTGI